MRYLLNSMLALLVVLSVPSCDKADEDTFVDDNYADADLVAGGQLYDKWWKVNNGTEPTTDFPLYSTHTGTATKTGGDTWRCKECHGWDYIGKDGRYASGSHYTGFAGVLTASSKTNQVIFDAIKDEGGAHDMSAVLSDNDVLNLTRFIREGAISMSPYITGETATGDAAAGATLYTTNCASCHGADGNTLDFDSETAGTQGVGFLSNDNPQETLHKIRWGHPGTAMPSAVDAGLTDDQTGHILAYAQSLPEAVHFATVNWTSADIQRGGQLYDKWWVVNSGTEPTADFTLYTTHTGTAVRTGSTTWRCKECHGWDYIGKSGRYATGSHNTGFDGIGGAALLTKTVIFDTIEDAAGTHDFSTVLADADLLDLTKFVLEGQVDMSLYIDTTGAALGTATYPATGNATAGATLYAANCVGCHGADGNTLDFDSETAGVQGVGFLSNDNPQETLHKIRWGHPGSPMPGMVVGSSLTDAQTGDILAHGQTLQ